MFNTILFDGCRNEFSVAPKSERTYYLNFGVVLVLFCHQLAALSPLYGGSMPNFVRVRVSGPLACFSRPECKVERLSYDCITPSAARGILDAIMWKPEMRWVIR